MARRATRALGDNCQPSSPNRQGVITVTDDETHGIVRATTLAMLEASRATYEVEAGLPAGRQQRDRDPHRHQPDGGH